MPLQLAPEEPEAGPWPVALLSAVLDMLTRPGPGQSASGRPVVLAVDGRSNSGKTTLAATHLIDALIWVQSDEREAGRRALARQAKPDAIDMANRPADGSPPADAEWMAEEIPFNTAQRTWERAGIIVCGTPEIHSAPTTEIIVAPAREIPQGRYAT
jgi:hypothetical protein